MVKSGFVEQNITLSQTIVVDEDGNTQVNPSYTALQSSYTVHKHALIIGDSLDTVNEETGEVEVPDNVVDVSSLLLVLSDEE